MKYVFLGVALLLPACSILDQTYDGLEEASTSSTGAEIIDDTTGAPEPTTGTSTDGYKPDLGSDLQTTEEPIVLEIVSFEASAEKCCMPARSCFQPRWSAKD